MEPFPLEKEFQIKYLRDHLHTLSREQLEELLGETIEVLAKMTHQMKQMQAMIQKSEEG